ncbi:hypothetical protein, partial [Pseudomonas viridiflava]|uniref:hypothetical protein n=1 Tax=Pseudomonas viridiflava TaxID=33069 RepID=UPI00197FF727
MSVLLPVPGRSLAAASHEATHISLKKILFFCGRRLAGDAVDAVSQENRVIVHRRQAASHGPCLLRDSAMSK